MRFQSIILSAASFAAVALAQSSVVSFTDVPTSVEAGKPVTVKYSAPPGSPVTITLRQGDSNDLKTVSTLTSSSTGGSFVWTPDSSLANSKDYALQISSGPEINFTGKISLSGGNGAPVVSSPATGSPTGSASAASASATGSASYATYSSSPITSAPTSLISSIVSSNSTTITISTGNSTVSTASKTSTRSSSTGSTTTGSTSAPTSNSAVSNLQSPIALVFGALFALAYLN